MGNNKYDILSKQEKDTIQLVKTYKPPICPGCGGKMNLYWGLEDHYDWEKKSSKPAYFAYCYCTCEAGWATRRVWHINAGVAVETAYKNAVYQASRK